MIDHLFPKSIVVSLVPSLTKLRVLLTLEIMIEAQYHRILHLINFETRICKFALRDHNERGLRKSHIAAAHARSPIQDR